MNSKRPTIGGQAVLEGVMMQSPEHRAIAVRRGDGVIIRRVEPIANPAGRRPFLGWPVVRGVVSFVMSLVVGVRTITASAEMLGVEAEEPTKLEKAVARATGKKTDDVMMFFAVAIAVLLAVGLFVFLPSLVVTALRGAVEGRFLINLLEGVVRLIIFFAYMLLVGLLPDIRRTFRYHGAEHKVVMTFETGGELTAENCMKASRFHPRCGTSFLFLVMFVSILCFSFLPVTVNVFARVGMRLLMMPLVAGLSYEVLKGVARRENLFTRIVRAPGLWTQRITTGEPDASMVEVALAAFHAALSGEIAGVPGDAGDSSEANDGVEGAAAQGPLSPT